MRSSLLALALSLLGLSSPGPWAQTFTASAGPGTVVGAVNQSSSDPEWVSYKGNGPTIVRQAQASADRGQAVVNAKAHHYDHATFQSDAAATATFELDDVVFTSPGSGTATVGMLLTIDGNGMIQNGGTLQLSVSDQSGPLGTLFRDVNGVSGTGHLAGWSGTGQIAIRHDITVPLNTATTIRVTLSLVARTSIYNHRAEGRYLLRFGGLTGSPPYSVFATPPGVSVGSPQASITSNMWSPPMELHLSTTDTVWNSGEDLTMTTWNGEAFRPVFLFVTSIDGTPTVSKVSSHLLDANGNWSYGPVPYMSALAGSTYGLTSLSFPTVGRAMMSNEELITVQ